MSQLLQLLLIGDGASDQVLSRIIAWAVRQVAPSAAIAPIVFRRRSPISRPLSELVTELQAEYRPNLLFVHRDAEKQSLQTRVLEIPSDGPVVPVIPVRMTEAWLLIDANAIRKAAGNPNGKVHLDLPPIGRLEQLPDPKKTLKELLEIASELSGRRLAQLDRASAAQRVADYIDDFSELRRLPAFKFFETELGRAWQRLQSAAP